MTLKLQISACNSQISTLKVSIIIMRHEVRVLLSDHRTARSLLARLHFRTIDLFRRIVASFCTYVSALGVGLLPGRQNLLPGRQSHTGRKPFTNCDCMVRLSWYILWICPRCNIFYCILL